MLIMEILKKFKHKIQLSVRYADLDTLAHVNNKAYLSYLEEARIAYYNDVIDLNLSNLDFSSVVANINISYKYPIFFSNKLVVYTRCSKIGSKSFELENVIVAINEKNEENIAATSITTMVSVDLKTGKTIENDSVKMDKIRKFEYISL